MADAKRNFVDFLQTLFPFFGRKSRKRSRHYPGDPSSGHPYQSLVFSWCHDPEFAPSPQFFQPTCWTNVRLASTLLRLGTERLPESMVEGLRVRSGRWRRRMRHRSRSGRLRGGKRGRQTSKRRSHNPGSENPGDVRAEAELLKRGGVELSRRVYIVGGLEFLHGRNGIRVPFPVRIALKVSGARQSGLYLGNAVGCGRLL